MVFGSFAVAVCSRERSRWWAFLRAVIGGGPKGIATLDRGGCEDRNLRRWRPLGKLFVTHGRGMPWDMP